MTDLAHLILPTYPMVRKHLAAMAPGEIVGIAGDPFGCPLHTVITEMGYCESDDQSVAVGTWHVTFYAPSQQWPGQERRVSFEAPEWVYHFVAQIDATCGRGQPVRVVDALAVLDAFPPQANAKRVWRVRTDTAPL